MTNSKTPIPTEIYDRCFSELTDLWHDIYLLKVPGKRQQILEQVADLLFIAQDTMITEELNANKIDEKLDWGEGATLYRINKIMRRLNHDK